MIFERYEDPEKSDQKLTRMEKSVIKAISSTIVDLTKKARRAKTYGDLVNLQNFIDEKMEEMEEKYGEQEFQNETSVRILEEELDLIKVDIKNL